MRVTLDDRLRLGAGEQARRGSQQVPMQLAALGRQPVAEVAREAVELPGHRVERGLAERADADTEPVVVPPGRVEASLRADDGGGLVERRRQGPGRGDAVRVGQVLEQEVPGTGVGVRMAVEAAQQQAGGRRRRDLAIEGDLALTGLPRAAGTIGQAGLEDQRGGCAVAAPPS